MTAPPKSTEPTGETEKQEKPETGGPTAPSVGREKSRSGPKTGEYDDHSPDQTPSNEKGGYGTG